MSLPADHRSTTDGEIAALNLRSARKSAWRRFAQAPDRPGAAEVVVEHELLAAQFLGDASALDRLEGLASDLARIQATWTALPQAQIASAAHRFADARSHLERADASDRIAAVRRLRLSVDQACGTHLDAVLEARLRDASSGKLEDLVPLGALFADLREFQEAEQTYVRALRAYDDVSPFAPAWVCFQLGMLWGELVPDPEPDRAVGWYRRAVDYVPDYAQARVHLAELLLRTGRPRDAEALLLDTLPSGDPEAPWRLADLLADEGRVDEGEAWLAIARTGYEHRLATHLLAFADHGAEFYAGSGNDRRRALALARVNVENRPTLRAFEQAHAIAVEAGDGVAASELLGGARERWGGASFFPRPPLAARQLHRAEMEGT